MTLIAESTLRIAFNAAALATLGTDPEWDAAVTAYLASATLAAADEAFGRTYKRQRELEWLDAGMALENGKNWRICPEFENRARELRESEDDLGRLRDTHFLRPMETAACRLVQTPAPTLAAAMLKLEIVDLHELHNDSRFPIDCMEWLRQDMRHVAGIDLPTAPTTG